jgi:hypothetical protein
MTATQRLVAFLFLLLSACAAQPGSQGASPVAAASSAIGQDLRQAWWSGNRWRYASDGEAEAAYQALLSQQSPWPVWHQPNVVTLPAGLRFEMALAPGQGTDSPGAFGTFDRIPDVRFVRFSLAVKTEWKPRIDRVVTYEIVTPLKADTGVVGPQIDVPANLYLPGGGSQLEMQVPKAERTAHLRVIAVRPIA